MRTARAPVLRGTAYVLRLLSMPFLLIGWFATPILDLSAWCERLADDSLADEEPGRD